MTAKFVYLVLLFNICYSDAFISSIYIQKAYDHKMTTVLRAHQNSTGNFNISKSKVYKMDFRSDEEKELEEFYKPRYLFNLSEFHMTFVRIYIYMVIILNCITLYLR
jgi:hypothetical protein